MALRQCRECKKEVSSEAKVCPNCGVSNPVGRKTSPVAWGCLAVIVLVGVFVAKGCSDISSRITTAAAPPPASNAPQLVLKTWSWSREYGYVTAVGQVKNISNVPLRNVEAVASFYDAKGTFITSGDALIDYNPILPGQTSPFHAMTTDNPAMRSASIEFKELMGGTIRYVEDSTGRHRR